jgi:glutathione synthase/RimK-type ligase-like ATP-grasp enzyme
MAPGALPEQEVPDHKLIVAAGLERGVSFETAYWDDATLPAQGFDAAIIRSCWDYTSRREEFEARITRHETEGLRVFNSSAVVRWNAQKTYLDDLGGLSIPTIWSADFGALDVARAFDAFSAAEIVAKPQVGAGSRNTIRLKRNQWSEADLIDGPRGAAMIQPYLSSIESEGERSLFWFGGKAAHAIRKVPNAGAWYANRNEAARFFAEEAPTAAREAAERALGFAPRDLLYVRVDLVRDDGGHWRVIEVEAIEPYLFLAFAPAATGLFVDAVAEVLSR